MKHDMQTVERADGTTYQTLNTRRLRNASPLQTDLPAKRKINIISVILIAAILMLVGLAILAGAQ